MRQRQTLLNRASPLIAPGCLERIPRVRGTHAAGECVDTLAILDPNLQRQRVGSSRRRIEIESCRRNRFRFRRCLMERFQVISHRRFFVSREGWVLEDNGRRRRWRGRGRYKLLVSGRISGSVGIYTNFTW